MINPIAVLSADLHLAQRAWVKHPGLAGDAYHGLSQLVDYCCKNELDLILAGDIYDKTRPDPTTVHTMRLQIDRLERQALRLGYIQGQHELDRSSTWLSASSWWPQHVHHRVFQIGDINFYGIDWTPADQVQDEFTKIPQDTDILVAHQVWRDLMGPRIGESECAFSDVPHVKMILTGDFHRHLQLSATNRQGEEITVLSPGPVCMQSIDEDPCKRFFVLHDDMSVHVEMLKTRNCYRFVINTKDDLDAFLSGNIETAIKPQEDVPINISKNIIHVTYQDDIPEIYTRITSAIGSKAHLFMIPVRHKQETITIDTERRRTLAEGGMNACLELVAKSDSPLYHDILALLNTETLTDAPDALKTLHSLFLQQRGIKP